VLLAPPSAKRPVPELSNAARARAAEDLLRYGWPLVERLDQTFAQTVADGLRSDATTESFGSEGVRELLARAARIVHGATGADQVFAQFGADVVAFPPHELAVRVQAGSDSLTAYARQHPEGIRILDINDTERRLQGRVNESGYQKLLECLGWQAARSVIFAPIDRDLGMLKVYTRDSGRFLTPGDLRIVKSVGEQLRTVAGPLVERAALHELNTLASKLAGLSGDELARQLVVELEAWTARYIKAGCMIYILAQTEAGVPMVAAGSPGLKHIADHFAEAQTRPDARTSFGGVRVLRESFILPIGHGLTGALFLCHKVALTQAAEPFVREAAREIALLLHAESVRQTLLQLQGILRHGLLGPVQGMMSHALSIGLTLEESGQVTEELAESIRQIRQEAAAIRSWRSENRLVASLQNHKRLDVRPRRSQLRVFVEDCADRFRYAAQERNLAFHMQLPPGGVLAEFDPEALDIALSNLMDNAIKYAFYNREITVGMQLRRHAVDIWVEDIGHGIPEHRKEAIYESGTRGGQIDPYRVRFTLSLPGK
jgi:signal transduction histidine kinase